MAVHRYRNKKTKNVASYPHPAARLERSDKWEKVDDEASSKAASKKS